MQSADQDAANPRPPANVVLSRDEVLIYADGPQEKIQDTYKVRDNVLIRFRNDTIHCDQATYDSTTGIINATGHVVYDGGAHGFWSVLVRPSVSPVIPER
jgi:lipopolysaccharide assembly outer membrane protein LptD (OstA)